MRRSKHLLLRLGDSRPYAAILTLPDDITVGTAAPKLSASASGAAGIPTGIRMLHAFRSQPRAGDEEPERPRQQSRLPRKLESIQHAGPIRSSTSTCAPHGMEDADIKAREGQ